MDVIHSVGALRERLQREPDNVFVPTMGNLHGGHIQLIGSGRSRAACTVVSIFVNRLQFNRADDFARYPRDIERDLRLCEDRGVATIYAPTHESMYPEGFQTHVEPGALAEPLEGAGRPGHFRGVVTVVTKLFNAVRPDIAVFGRKDFQQLAIVERMVADLDMGIEIIGLETVREPDGLAMSSRNQRLSAEERRAAVVVPRALDAVAAAVESGQCLGASGRAGTATPGVLDRLRAIGVAVIEAEPLARIEYFDIVDPATLRTPATEDVVSLHAVAAVWFGDVRLIDNRVLR